ncbi:MAG: hypothetical protein Q9166_005211 [cf. Caloplaca sp. 2 TL-2023]
MAAVHDGHSSTAQLLLTRGAGVNVMTQNTEENESGLLTIRNEVSRSVEYIFSRSNFHDGCEVAKYSGYSTPVENMISSPRLGSEFGSALHVAVWAKRADPTSLIQLLLGSGADVNVMHDHWGTPLPVAARNPDSAPVVRALLESRADPNAEGGVARLLLESGAKVNGPADMYGSLLRGASRGEHLKKVRLLIDFGADVNARGGFYASPLHAASAIGHLAIVEVLLAHRANVNAQGGIWGSPLQAALGGGYKEAAVDEKWATVARRLLEAEAEPIVDQRLQARLEDAQSDGTKLNSEFEPCPGALSGIWRELSGGGTGLPLGLPPVFSRTDLIHWREYTEPMTDKLGRRFLRS